MGYRTQEPRLHGLPLMRSAFDKIHGRYAWHVRHLLAHQDMLDLSGPHEISGSTGYHFRAKRLPFGVAHFAFL